MAPIARFPANLFGAPMGLVGLGLVLREAGHFWAVPGWLAEFWIVLGTAAFCVFLACYALKWLRHAADAKAEFGDPLRMCFISAAPVGGSLVAGGLFPYAPELAHVLWWVSAVAFLGLQVWGVSRWLGGIELAQIHGGWMIMLLAGLVFPISGVPMHHLDMTRFMYGAAIIAAPFVVGFIVFRMTAGPVLPDVLKPTAFILLVPGGLLYANYPIVSAEPPLYVLAATFYCAVTVLAGLLVYARKCFSWPFGPSWWAFTFPLDSMAAGGLRHWRLTQALAAGGPVNPAWEILAGALVLLAVAVVSVVTVRAAAALARGTLWN